MLLKMSYLLCNIRVTKRDRILHAGDMFPAPNEQLKCECKEQMNLHSAGHVPCLPARALGAAANVVSHSALQPLRCNSLEAEAI